MALLAEYIVFGILMALNLYLGAYISLRGKTSRAQTTAEVFLGSRSLRVFPLAASVAASLISSTSLVALTGHFYAYGFHFIWSRLLTIPAAPVASHMFLPVLYGLRVTSVFQYIRMRFHLAISLTACVVYILVTLSIGAVSIFAASLTLVTVFGLPLVWCNIVIGLSSTIYTALGGLRAVVWTDCVQLLFILLGPATIITKVFIDWRSPGTSVQPIEEFDTWSYIGKTVLTGSVLLVAAYTVELLMALSLVLWFRGCDPQLSGAIKNTDQVLPFYIKTHLMQFPGFTGLFLAAVVSAGASTISSSINSMTALLHVDVLPYFFKSASSDVQFRTQGLAFLLGAVMTIYSCICVYVGSVTRAMILVYSAAAGPCIGLLLLAIGFPFVHSKGAGISTLLFFTIQLYFLWQRIEKKILPQRMPVTLQYCPRNTTYVQKRLNDTYIWSPHRSVNHDAPYVISPFWSSLFSTAGTLLLGIMISIATGEHRRLPADLRYLNPSLAKMWLKLHVIRDSDVKEAQPENEQETTNTALVSNEEEMGRASTNV